MADLRFAARQLRRNPGFTAAAVITLALGIGACTAAYSIARGLLWRELPFQDADRPGEERISDLVSRMTLEEKIAQLQNATPAIPRLGVQAYDWWNESLHGVARAGAARPPIPRRR